MFTFQHNNPPQPFKPLYIEYAKDVRTLATYDCCVNGVYDNPDKSYRAMEWRKYYDARMKKGKPYSHDVKVAKDYIYNL